MSVAQHLVLGVIKVLLMMQFAVDKSAVGVETLSGYSLRLPPTVSLV